MSKQNDCLLFSVADIVFAISSSQQTAPIVLEDSYEEFFCTSKPEVNIKTFRGALPEMQLRENNRVFEGDSVWNLYLVNDQYVFVLTPDLTDFPNYRVAVFSSDFREGKVYSHMKETVDGKQTLTFNPLEFPLANLLMICLLGKGRGLLAHACGVDDAGKGYLFAGNSSHGKSTMAKLWQNEASILNDDRIAVRWQDGCFWMYGTPWHSEVRSVSSHRVPIRKIFFVDHADSNHANLKEGVLASTLLLNRCFLPLWDRAGMEFSLSFIEKIVQSIPCYELGFAPDKDIIEFVREL